MKLILAQGNPESRFTATRHNIGFTVADALVEAHGGSWAEKTKFHASVAEVVIADKKVLIVKPKTYYNETGRTARALLDFYKLTPSDLLVIHDDLALPFGTLRTRDKGSDAGNNGIKSLNTHLGNSYWRLRIGVWNELRDRMPDANFVLSRFTKAESDTIAAYIAPAAQQVVQQFCYSALEPTSIQTIPT